MSETPEGYTRGMGFIAPIAFTLANMVINVAASTLPAWAAATSYASGVPVIDGASRIIYRSLKDNNVGNVPALSGNTSAGAWQAIGVEERLRMFDASLGSYTERADMIEVQLKPGRVITDIALFGVRATSVQVLMIDANDGQVFDSGDVSMLRPSGNSHWGYFFNPIERDERLLISGLPAYTQATTIVRIKAAGAVARCGEIVAGRAVWLGNTYWRPSIGFDEFGEKKRDAWGGWMVTDGAYSDWMKLQVLVQGTQYERTRAQVVAFRKRPIVWIGARGVTALMTYGYLMGFEQVLVTHGISDCNLTINGLEITT